MDFPTQNLFNSTYDKLPLTELRLIAPTVTIGKAMEILHKNDHLGIVSHSQQNNVTAIISEIDLVRYLIPKFQQHKKESLHDPVEWVLTLNPADGSQQLK
jgi:CBS domain-containing protein